ncbi:uncharacterized protein LOC123037186 [Drosophila rhopaloa]|uniref:Integrase catalytic domain-containing protein n=1 Tax=Drosophila rhopaloa TaxID=1041015 RepID=A0ABM5J1Q4_DRORH|nr:uncharacterized protein LOC123037186 [Drosophila rhopaloa]
MDASAADAGSPTLPRSAILKCKANALLQDLKRIQGALHPISSVEDAMLHVRHGQLVSVYDDFKAIHGNLEELDISEIGSDLRWTVSELVATMHAEIEDETLRRSAQMAGHSTLTNGISSMPDPGLSRSFQALPPIPLPTFSGGYSEWSEFQSIFSTMVGGNPHISKVEKLQRLRSCLRDSALEAVRSLVTSEENYDVALGLLEKRFSNRRLIFQAHVNEILGLCVVEGGSVAGLRGFSDKFNAHMRALKNLGTTQQIAGCIIVQVLLQRLDPATQAKWEEGQTAINSDLIPTWDSMAEFLEQRCRTLEAVDVAMAAYAPGTQSSSGHLPVALPISSSSEGSEPLASSPSTVNALIAQGRSGDIALLATANILVRSRAGIFVPCRALLDSGSQVHMITSRLANQLQLRKCKSFMSVSGIGDTGYATDGFSVDVLLRSHCSEYSSLISAVVAGNITDLQPSFCLDVSNWNIPCNLNLADPEFFRPQRIDLLIGASLFYELLCVGQVQLSAGLPLLQKTRLGWVVCGGGSPVERRSLVATACKDVTKSPSLPDERLDCLLRQFWEIEDCSEPIVKWTKEELDCEAHFVQHSTRLKSGAYAVRLPLKCSSDLLGESYPQAVRRFLSLERKLSRHPQLKNQYAAFIKEYLELGHMSAVPANASLTPQYFLPHHCVLKEDSSTTKLRVVFDGSAATTSGYSLNDVLMSGPVIQPKLLHILLRFRYHRVAITGDICKMYRCVRVFPEDSHLQCILWRDSTQDELQVFKLDTVTYGTKPASFLSVRAMHQLAEDEQSMFPKGAEILRRDFYVDDLISGGASVAEAVNIMQQTSGILAKGQFRLRKWCSNVAAVLSDVPEEDRESFLRFDDGSNFTKTLGLAWDPATDRLLFSFEGLQSTLNPTRRIVLSSIARLYDPLGLVGPVITRSKIFLQKLCREKLSWDESLPQALHSDWEKICCSFAMAQRADFPRWSLSSPTDLEIHGFCDASIEAYGACIYVVSRGTGAGSHLLCSKSRVAPLKTVTVPKLELSGAELLARLMSEVANLKMYAGKHYCWCDSAVALSWIREEPARFNVFVANRVATIQELTRTMEWRYVPTSLNPADILSRGALPNELIVDELWAHGPPFLLGPQDEWPVAVPAERPTLELRAKVLLIQSPYVDIIAASKYANSFSSLQRVFAYVHKFCHRIRHKGITAGDIKSGTQLLLRLVQRVHFWDDIRSLQNGKEISSSSVLATSSPFLDKFGLLRVDGRLKNSPLDFDSRHPIILPRSHPVTLAIIVDFHERNLHTGPRALLAMIRSQYWPIGGRKTVTKALHKCIRCFRSKPRLLEHIMADLPEQRVNGCQVFGVTGVDFCGPFHYKPEVRNKAPVKCYVSVFICFATKAVHLELVKDLSTTAFLQALKRFICTRRKPQHIWSDNATNFVGARNELSELRRLFISDEHQRTLLEFCAIESIEWHFIPPRSPHFGGLWEAAVKTAKHHFYRAVGSSILGFEELRTLLCHIGAVINSRPLLPLSEDPADLDVLTPAHFLTGGPPSSLIEPDVTKLNFNRLDSWQRVSFLQQSFWSRWKEEYLSLLQQRSKWRTSGPALAVNDVVLVKDENLPPMKWPLARIMELVSGRDGVARVAVIRTSSGTTKRAVSKLCLLPLKDEVGSQAQLGGECRDKQQPPPNL